MTLTVTLTVTLIQESLSDLRTAVEREPHAAHHRVEYEIDFVSGQPKVKKQKGSHEA